MCQAGPTYISDICELGHKYPVWQLERVAMTSAEREVDLFGGHYEVPPSEVKMKMMKRKRIRIRMRKRRTQ